MVVLTGSVMVVDESGLEDTLASASRICDRILVVIDDEIGGDPVKVIEKFDNPPSLMVKYLYTSQNNFTREFAINETKRHFPDTEWVLFLDEGEEIVVRNETPVEEIRSIIGAMPPEFDRVFIDPNGDDRFARINSGSGGRVYYSMEVTWR